MYFFLFRIFMQNLRMKFDKVSAKFPSTFPLRRYSEFSEIPHSNLEFFVATLTRDLEIP